MTEQTASSSFAGVHGRDPEVRASAPGRVNLIGDHTDYNGGFVLPLALPQRTRVELARRSDRRVRAASTQLPGDVRAYELGQESAAGVWLDYVQGVTAVLAQDRHALSGFDLWVDSDVPIGGGLSSSAALEVGLLRGLRDLFSLPIDDLALALLAHRAESGFVGVPVGVMDPLVVSLGDPSQALFIDTRSLETRAVALPPALGLVVVYSGLHHELAASHYRVRRAECDAAASALGVAQLRDIQGDASADVAALPGELQRRVRHVVSENDRVLAAIDALRAGDLPALGALFDASHRSLRDDFAVSTPEIEALVELAREHGVYGARLTGGGFGGSVVAVARAGDAARVAREVTQAYARATRLTPAVVLPWLRGSESRTYCPP